jgi:hypothetical protein
MPCTSTRSSGDLNGPLASRQATIASARAGPIPFSSRASVAASAVLMSTGPAQAMTGSSASVASSCLAIRIMSNSLLVKMHDPSGREDAIVHRAGA